MRRRSRASSKLTKARSHKAKTLKAARDSSSLASGQKTGVARLTRELKEAREQQVATADVLKVISRSPSDVQPVFDMIAESARRLCGGQFCFVYRFDGQLLHFVAHHSLTPEVLEMNRRAYPAPPSRKSAAARAILERGFVQIPDTNAEPDYALGAMAVVGKYRSVVAVPIIRDDLAIGSIAVARAQAGLLPDPQIELLKTFANQAAIAIENVRLFNAEQQRTRELTESLEQQTATADVLRVISSSPGELQPVFQAMLENATRICEASFGTLYLFDDDAFRAVAMHNAPPTFAEVKRRDPVVRPSPSNPMVRVARTKRPLQARDVAEDSGWPRDDAQFKVFANLTAARSFITIPMLKDNIVIGVITVYRLEPRQFTDKQAALLMNFAAQAVIAIENARLLNELRHRTDDLSESLERQTATSEVLKVISSSPGDLQPVFDAILTNATDLCGAGFASLRLSEGDQFRTVSLYNAPATLVEHWRSTPLVRPHPESALGRAARTKQVIQIDDVKKGPAYSNRDSLSVAGADLGGYRPVLAVPMLREDVLVGVVSVYRQAIRPFTEKQIELVKSFASQAAIAIENTRLLNELRESLERQTATSKVLEVISSSPGDLEPVFEAVLENATRICEANFGQLQLYEN